MEIGKKIKGLKPIYGIIVAVLGILLLIFIAAPIQSKFGMLGLAITEIMILLLAVIAAVICKADLKTVFPIKKIKMTQLFGTVLIWIGSYLGIMILTLIIGYFFPESLINVSEGLSNVITSVPFGIAFFIVAIMPAICEEALMRGFILSSFRSFKSKWSIVLLVGIIFGIFHLDFIRFAPTAILGMALAYIMLETNNILLPMIFHFINNGLSTVTSFFVSATKVPIPELNSVPLISIGSYFIIGAIMPFMLLLGAKLLKKGKSDLNKDGNHKKKINPVYIATFLTILMLIIGSIIVGVSISKEPDFLLKQMGL